MSLIATAQAAGAATESTAHGGFFSEPEVWVAIVFILVMAFLARPVFRAITAGLDLRREKIRARIDEAEKLRCDAQELLASYQKKQREAAKEAQDIVARAQADAVRIAAEAARELDLMLKRREQQAMERLAQAEADALKEVRSAAVEVAMAATARLLAQDTTPEQAGALVDAAIKDLPNRLN